MLYVFLFVIFMLVVIGLFLGIYFELIFLEFKIDGKFCVILLLVWIFLNYEYWVKNMEFYWVVVLVGFFGIFFFLGIFYYVWLLDEKWLIVIDE